MYIINNPSSAFKQTLKNNIVNPKYFKMLSFFSPVIDQYRAGRINSRAKVTALMMIIATSVAMFYVSIFNLFCNFPTCKTTTRTTTLKKFKTFTREAKQLNSITNETFFRKI